MKKKQTNTISTYLSIVFGFHHQTFFYSSKSFVSTHQISFLYPTTTNKILKAHESKSKRRMVEQQRSNFFPKQWKRRKKKKKNEEKRDKTTNEECGYFHS